ncbi:M56 family metallopeptidase [Winogradskyella psychrotolerans]|uniref:M56 family metallopeptidase n=1 Tax=Winogradskyella psychrotolerans TaxID=1344585 RepID=UPI001C068DE6|nr:M56 family metallopeptidase [Winogradskyella psychrotolerans]MBU2927814.1 M56 family metallopeptidase [Winogradskyella psychrotolerans]
MLYSILQIIAFQAVFLLIYDLFLKRETFFNYNRAYLIMTSVLALVLPFLKFPELKSMATKDMVIHLPEVFIGTKTPTVYDMQTAELAGIVLEQPQTPIWQTIALIGVVIASLIFLVKITKLLWLKYKNPKRWKGNVLIVQLIKSSAAFSFFNTIFLGERITETEKPTIYEHELVHIKEFHTVDLLFFELLRIVFWFNPLVYIYQNRIKELHEYIADAKAVKQSGKTEYYTSLLNQVLDVNHVSFTNTFFNKSLIKKRITMLQKSKSKQLNLIKYALLIPMVFGMLIYTSTDVRAQQKTTQQEQAASQELTDEELIKKYYDEIAAMKQAGANFSEVSDYAGFSEETRLKYMLSREEFLKSIAFNMFVADGNIQRKSEDGNLTQDDINLSQFMKERKYRDYQEYRTYKNTKEAKEYWELSAHDGVLKLFVEDAGNKTKEETKRFNALIDQLENDDYFKKLVISSNSSTIIIDAPNTQNQEIHVLKDVFKGVEVPFSVVDESPTTFECKDLESNSARKNCMNSFINKHLGKNFNTSVGDNLSPGRKRVFVQFKIDTDGSVKDIVARGPSPMLEEEAKRVIATLPQFIPGKQKGKAVIVPFSIPIVFQVASKGIDTTNVDETKNLKEALYNSSNKSNKKELVEFLKDEIKKLEKDIERSEAVPFSEVEVAPIHPDCESLSNTIELKDCLAHAINKLVGKNFDTNIANSLGLPAGQKRIFTQFIIDKSGNVTNIVARGPHPKLEEETVRVLKLLPKFRPATQEGEVVAVSYSLPIVFQTHDIKKD